MNRRAFAIGGCCAIANLVSLLAMPHVSLAQASPYAIMRSKILTIEVVGRNTNNQEISTYGTGFFIGSAGYALTAAHIFSDLIDRGAVAATIKATARVADFTGSIINVELIDRNNQDVALLKLSPKVGGYPIAKLMCNSNFDLNGNRVFTSGFYSNCTTYSADLKTCLQSTINYSQSSGEAGEDGNSPLPFTRDVNVAFAHGNSGSPVYTGNGTVVGIAKGAIQSAPNRSVYIPISWAEGLVRLVPGISPCVDLSQCIKAKLSDTTTDKFVQTGGARAPGTGAGTQSLVDQATVCYTAPPNFEIEGQVNVRDEGNNGGRGRIGPVVYGTTDGRTVSACVKVEAWSEAKMFGAGGWQNVTLSGLIKRPAATEPVILATREFCLNEIQQ